LRVVLACLCLALVSETHAYIDLAPTLSKIVGDAQKISVVEVVDFNEATQILTLKEVRALKGAPSQGPIHHYVGESDGKLVPAAITQWAGTGARGVLFSSRTTSLLCFGEGWYQAKLSGGEWKLGVDRSDLPLAYYGTVSRLADGIATMLEGGTATLTTVQHGADDSASFDLALNRMNLPGVIRVQRIRANMSMPPIIMAVSANSAYVIGPGRVGEEALPSLLRQLASADAAVRADAAAELQQLGRKAQSAESRLVTLLTDPAARVRLSAASALLNLDGRHDGAVSVLAQGLTNANAGIRRAAADAIGRAGLAAAPLVDNLAAALKDQDVPARRAAVRAVATLGSAAAGAASALVPLLNDPKLMIEAADALGRIGPAARPIPAGLITMLAADQPMAVRLAALRAMSQIGGPEARPAVDFIIEALPTADEISTYNMLIYLSLLGPVATDAIPASQSTKLRNPVLPTATLWAIKADSLPWQAQTAGGGAAFGGFGPPGGFPPGGFPPGGFPPGGFPPGGFPPGGFPPGGFPPGGFGLGGFPGMSFDLFSTMYVAYFRELGERLRPVALILLKQMHDGTANDTPDWGYKLLACAPEESLVQLSAALTSESLATREHAAVALGYMGAPAFPARAALQAALDKAPTEREKRLLEWAVSETSSD
jgi:HEAT repeat protein